MKTVQVSRAGAVIGQFEPAEVRQGLIVGTFLATDHYWTPGMKGWMPLSQFNEGSAGSITKPASKPKAGRKLTGWLLWRVSLVPDKMGYAEWTNRFVVAFLCVATLLLLWLLLKYDAESAKVSVRIETPARAIAQEARTVLRIKESKPAVVLERPAPPVAVSRAPSLEETKAKAEQGDASAQFMMGRYYAEVSPSLDESFSWHHKAAMQGHELAQVTVAAAFYSGKGAPKDEIEAYAFWSIAALQNEDASRSLMSMLEHGWLSQEARMKGTKRAEQLLGEIRAGQLLNGAGPTPPASRNSRAGK